MVGIRRSQRSQFTRFALGIALVGFLRVPDREAKVLPSVKARAPKPEAPRAADLPSDAELQQQGARIGEIRFDERDLFDVEAEDEDTSRLAPRESPAHHDAPGDHRRSAAVQERRSLPAGPARRIGAHPARHAVPARCADPAGGVSRRRGRHRSDHAGCLDFQSGHFLRAQGRRELRRLRARGTQLSRHRHAAWHRSQVRRRSRFEIHPLPRSPAGFVLVEPVDRLLGQQRRPPRGVLPRASVLRARQPPGRRRVAARRPAHRLALRPRRDRRSVRDARKAVDYLLGRVERPGRTAGCGACRSA